MKTTIKEQIENLLYRRKELKIDVEKESTPSREEAKKIVCDELSCDLETVRIIKVDSRFGEKVFTIIAEVYDSKEYLKEYSPTLKKKDLEAEKKKLEEEEAAKVAASPDVPQDAEQGGKAEAEKSVEAPKEEVAKEELVEEKAEEAAPLGVPSNTESEGKEIKEEAKK